MLTKWELFIRKRAIKTLYLIIQLSGDHKRQSRQFDQVLKPIHSVKTQIYNLEKLHRHESSKKIHQLLVSMQGLFTGTRLQENRVQQIKVGQELEILWDYKNYNKILISYLESFEKRMKDTWISKLKTEDWKIRFRYFSCKLRTCESTIIDTKCKLKAIKIK